MKTAAYIYRGLLVLLNLGLAALAFNSFSDQSRPHQAGLFGSNVVPANHHLVMEALSIAAFALLLAYLATWGWRLLKGPVVKIVLVFVAVFAYVPYAIMLAFK